MPTQALAFAAALLLPSLASAATECLSTKCQNPDAVTTMQAQLGNECDCAAASSAREHMKCTRRVIDAAVDGGTLPPRARARPPCEAELGCGVGHPALPERPGGLQDELRAADVPLGDRASGRPRARRRGGVVPESRRAGGRPSRGQRDAAGEARRPEGQPPHPQAEGPRPGHAHARDRSRAPEEDDPRHREVDQARRAHHRGGVRPRHRNPRTQAAADVQRPADHRRRLRLAAGAGARGAGAGNGLPALHAAHPGRLRHGVGEVLCHSDPAPSSSSSGSRRTQRPW